MSANETKLYPVLFGVVLLVVGMSLYLNGKQGPATLPQLAAADNSLAARSPFFPQSGVPLPHVSSRRLPTVSDPSRQDQPLASLPSITDEDYRKHIAALRETVSDDSYSIVLQKPFVVIGNESFEVVQQRAERTVKWAVDRLKDQYFEKDPNKIIDIWLMKDKLSYEEQCLRVVKYKPNTPYGFYSSTHNVLMMNISTGGGTLVHEIVHPFIEANFPACPAWFNEGLASLYEQSSSNQDDKIVGLTNWRLRGLQLAIQDDQVPSFQTLCSTTTNQFYREDPGTNYSQARYLCYYLQQKGKLQQFYQRFVANCAEDETGYQTLVKVLEVEDMQEFKKDWQDYVMQLRFP